MAATEENPLILFDFKSKVTPYICWNVNVWKARLVLNYKRIPYKTVWIHLHETSSTLSKLGFPAPPPGGKYTLPAISDPAPSTASNGINGTITGPVLVYDSFAIAQYLDAAYPDTPRVFPPGSETLQRVWYDRFNSDILVPTIALPWTRTIDVISEDAKPYICQLVERAFGKSVEEVTPQGDRLEGILVTMENEYGKLAGYIKLGKGKGKDGVDAIHVGGEKPIFVDLQILAHLIWMRTVLLPEHWERVSGWNNGLWGRILASSEGLTRVV